LTQIAAMSAKPPEKHRSDLAAAAQRKGSFLQTARAVAWSFLGIRRGADYANDVGKLNPVHVIIAGVLAALLFVLGLITLIHWVVGSGVAAS
jgi:amino acid transporter